MSNIQIGISKYKNDNGVSCYMNSILHILQQLPIFSDYLITGNFYKNLKDKLITTNSNQFVTYELYKLFKLSHENNNSTITPASFKNTIGMKNDRWLSLEQQDSQEFFIFIISHLEEELGKKISFLPNKNNKSDKSIDNNNNNNINNNNDNNNNNNDKIDDIYKLILLNKYQDNIKNNFSIIKELFIGSISSNLICNYCKTKSPSLEDFITLSIDIPVDKQSNNITLLDCLNYTYKDEQLDNKNKCYCQFCGLKNKSIIQKKIWKSPKILVIHLKRFKFNDYGIQTAKITNPINYPITDLNIDFLFDSNSPYKNKTNYKLVGINIHHEFAFKSIDAGHYISIVKNRFDDEWYLFNDSKQPIKLTLEQIQNKKAYMLFYIKLN